VGQPPHGSVAKSHLGLPDYGSYSWTRDVDFLQLNPNEQLERINIARFQQESSQVTFRAAATDPSGDIYAVGQVVTDLGSPEDDDIMLQGLTVRYDSNLNQIGFSLLPDYSSYITVATDDNGFIYAVGHDNDGALVVKYDAVPNEVSRCALPAGMTFYSAGFTSDKCLLLCGYGDTGSLPDGTYRSHGLIARLSSSLELLDSVTWQNGRYVFFNRLVIGSDNSVYVAGSSASGIGSDNVAVLLKFDSNLDLLKTTIKAEMSFNNRFSALAVGADGSIYVVYSAHEKEWGGGAFINSLVIRYNADLTEQGSLYLPDVYQNHFFIECSIVFDQSGYLYCIGKLIFSEKGNIAAVILDGDLSVVNSAAWSIGNDLMIELHDVTIADDGSVYIVGNESPRLTDLIFAGQTYNPPEFVRAVIFK
jgi:hypothetical protein